MIGRFRPPQDCGWKGFETDRPNAILLGMVLQIFNSVISKTEFVK